MGAALVSARLPFAREWIQITDALAHFTLNEINDFEKTAMKIELMQPTATIVAALISTEADRSSTGHRVSCQDLFVATYRKLEAAMLEIQKEDKTKNEAQLEPHREYV